MQSEIPHLIQLQELDLASERIRRRVADIPLSIAALDSRLADRTATVAAIKARIAASQESRRETEKELATVQARLSKYKGQLMEVKTNKEYQAMQHEIAAAEQVVREHEDRLLDRMEEQETLSAELKQAEAALKTEQVALTAEKQKIEAERGELEKTLAQHTAERSALAGRVSRPALELFEHVAKHRRGVAMSEARAGSCTQCHVRMRPQVFNEVRRNDALHQCDSCSRILYYVPAPAETTTPQ
jgi:predicted  nucleic acid-binding Zn-ribbon protein